MKLKTINDFLRKFGIVLVVQTGDNFEPTILCIQRVGAFK